MAGNSDNITLGSAVISLDSTDVGYTEGGVQVRHNSEFIDVIADQASGVVKKFRSLERMYIKFTMLEVTLENMKIAMMQPDGNLVGSVLTLGYNDACWVREHAVTIVGKGDNCATRTWQFDRAIITGERTLDMKHDGLTMLELEMEIMKDDTGAFGSVTQA